MRFLSIILILNFGPIAVARTVPGPFVSFDDTQESGLKSLRAGELDGKLRSRRLFTKLLAPLPGEMAGFTLVGQLDYAEEARTARGKSLGILSDRSAEKVALLAPGLIALRAAPAGQPQWFLVAARYSAPGWNATTRPMGEWIVGFDQEHLGGAVFFGPGWSAESRLLVRYRHFPFADRYLLLAEHKVQHESGAFGVLSIPSHALVGVDIGDWAAYGGGRLVSKEYPLSSERGSLWMEGHTTSVLIGARRRIHEILFATIEVGSLAESMAYISESNETLQEQETSFAPWVKFALETFLDPAAGLKE